MKILRCLFILVQICVLAIILSGVAGDCNYQESPSEDTAPSEGDAEPAEEDVEPAEGDAEPAEEDVEPAEEDAEPAEEDAAFVEDTTAPSSLAELSKMAKKMLITKRSMKVKPLKLPSAKMS